MDTHTHVTIDTAYRENVLLFLVGVSHYDIIYTFGGKNSKNIQLGYIIRA